LNHGYRVTEGRTKGWAGGRGETLLADTESSVAKQPLRRAVALSAAL